MQAPEIITYIDSSPYKFMVKRNILTYDDMVISLNYKIGGDYDSCINISYRFQNNIPIVASIPRLSYEPECSVGSNLAKGAGTETLIRSAVAYAYSQVPSIPLFSFDDASHIDCFEGLITSRPPRKQLKPLNLAYLSIAYYGMTWYEKTFNAKMVDAKRYARYRETLRFLTDPQRKMSFHTFLEISQPATDQIIFLKGLYVTSNTYREFFTKIPRDKRCTALFGWINSFMNYYLGEVYTEKGWQLDARILQKGGGRRKRSAMYVFNYLQSNNF